jgi:sortase A
MWMETNVTRSGRRSGTRIAIAAVVILLIGGIAVFSWYRQHRQQAPAQQQTAAHQKPLPPQPQQPPITVLNNEANKPAPRLHAGQVLGRIEIPRLKVATPIIEGTDEAQLKRGAGHVPSTAAPGADGNVAIAAHRDKFFRALRNIRAHDEITLTTPHGVYRYVVLRTEIVTPKDVSVLRPTATPQLTLLTCYPFYYVGHAPKRFVVHAERTS